jgi:tRNA A-37 threonylcarbamoyl transferase component Bud32
MVRDTKRDNPPFKRFSKGDMNGWIKEEIWNFLPDAFFGNPISSIRKMDGKVIGESKFRFSALFILPNKRRLFLKRDVTKGGIESFKYFFLPTKARKEWSVACQALKKNIRIPQPLGWMERRHRGLVKESYYLSEAVGSGISLIEDSAALENPLVLLEMGRTLKEIHHAGLFHKDLHAGNFLWDGRSLHLVDLHNARIFPELSLNQRLWNLALLFQSLRPVWGEKHQSLLMDNYFEEEPLYLQHKGKWLQKIHRWMDRLQKRHWKSRTKRCLTESTEFSVEVEKGGTTYHRRDIPIGVLKEWVEGHRRYRSEKPSHLLKFSPGVTVSLLGGGGKKISVKNYHPPKVYNRLKDRFRRSKGMRAWVSGNGMRARGFPTLKPLGLMEKRDILGLRESFFIMEVLKGAQELDRFICKGFDDFKKKRVFIKTFTQWLYRFHQMGLYHKDMKTCNILVSENEGSWDFRLLDLEDVVLDKRITEKKFFRSLLQLNTSTPKIITRSDRLRFFKEYHRLNPVVRNRKILLKRLVEESHKRGLVYVSPQGVVIEKL